MTPSTSGWGAPARGTVGPRLRAVALGAAACAVACAGNETTLVVHLIAPPGVRQPARVRAAFTGTRGGQVQHHSEELRPRGDRPALTEENRSLVFAIVAAGYEGEATIAVEAVGDGDTVIAAGRVSAVLEDGKATHTSLVLEPVDFQINSGLAGGQTFGLESTGRQVAGLADGFVAVWRSECTAQSACPIYARRFDRGGVPTKSGPSGSTDDFPVSELPAGRADNPAVAALSDGRFLVVWQRGLDEVSAHIRGRAFAPDGHAVGSSGGTLSDGRAPDAVTPDVAAIDARTYAVVWAQRSAAGAVEIVGRLIGPEGGPVARWDGQTEPFVVGPIAEGDLRAARPALAASTGGSFAVLWRDGERLALRLYGPGAEPLSPSAIDVTETPPGAIAGFDLAGLPYGYAAVWSSGTGSSSDGYDIHVRRFLADGPAAPLDATEYTINTFVEGDQTDPSVAARADGSLLVAWASSPSPSTGPSGEPIEDPAGGVRARLLLSSGLPIGEDFVVNTTLPNAQATPAVAALGRDAFVVAFRDGSQMGPDTDGTGIRARALYPNFGPRDGRIGALCDRSPVCESGLVCGKTPVGARCMPR